MSVDLHVDLFIDGAWVDITSYVRGINGRDAITITWGSTTRGTAYRPLTAIFQLNDPDAVFNNANPYSAYFGKIGNNILARVRKGASDIRAFGEFARRKPKWRERGGKDAIVDCVIAGRSRRLDAGNKPLSSPAYRSLTTAASLVDLVAYWPFEDEVGATTLAPYIGNPLPSSGVISIGAHTSHPASTRMITLGTGGGVFAPAPAHTATGEYKFVSTWHIPSSIADGARIFRLHFSGGSLGFIEVWVNDSSIGTPEGVQMWFYGTNNLAIDAPTLDASGVLWDDEVTLSLELKQNGTAVDVVILVVGQSDTALSSTLSVASVTIGTWTGTTVSPQNFYGDFPTNGVGAEGASFGHLAVATETGAFADFISPTTAGTLGTRAFAGDPAGRRIERVCADIGADFVEYPAGLSGTLDRTGLVGAQRAVTARQVLEAATAVDGGLIGDARDSLAVVFRPLRTLYSQAPKATLTYAAPTAHLSGTFSPADGDLIGITNDVKASRDGGSSARVAITADDGYHGTIDEPPDGVGDYDTGPSFGCYTDSQLNELAAWTAHLGSWLEPLYNEVTVELTRQAFVDNPTLAAQVASIYLGDPLKIDTSGSSPWLPADSVELLAIGGTETLAQMNQTIVFNTISARSYEVWQVETGGSTIANAQATSGTAWRLATALGPAWSTAVPYRIQAGGEAVQVSAISTETITVGTPGSSATGNNASVVPGMPTVNPGDAMIMVAAIRSSGTGTVNTPTGWTLLPGCDGSNLRVFGRYFRAGDTSPTVSFTGGAAGDDTYARIFPAPGASLEQAGGTKINPVGVMQLNGSATNVAYPALPVVRAGAIVFYVGWRQDDATSVATIAGATELADTAMATGNDMHIMVDYVIQTTAANIPAGSFTVTTGGGAAISRGIVLALRPLQAATVVRNQYGINVAIAAGSAVKGWRMGLNGL